MHLARDQLYTSAVLLRLPSLSFSRVATSEFSDSEFDDSLSTYLDILEQHDQSVANARREGDPEGPEVDNK